LLDGKDRVKRPARRTQFRLQLVLAKVSALQSSPGKAMNIGQTTLGR